MAALQHIPIHPKTLALLEDLQKAQVTTVTINSKGIDCNRYSMMRTHDIIAAHGYQEYFIRDKQYRKPKKYHGLHCGEYDLSNGKIVKIR